MLAFHGDSVASLTHVHDLANASQSIDPLVVQCRQTSRWRDSKLAKAVETVLHGEAFYAVTMATLFSYLRIPVMVSSGIAAVASGLLYFKQKWVD